MLVVVVAAAISPSSTPLARPALGPSCPPSSAGRCISSPTAATTTAIVVVVVVVAIVVVGAVATEMARLMALEADIVAVVIGGGVGVAVQRRLIPTAVIVPLKKLTDRALVKRAPGVRPRFRHRQFLHIAAAIQAVATRHAATVAVVVAVVVVE